jgi:hypothetical protein
VKPVRYSHALLSFVDILGFRSLVARSSAEEVFQRLRRANALTVQRFGSKSKMDKSSHFAFSDSIVVATPVGRAWGASRILARLLFDAQILGRWQFLLAREDIFVRGGVTLGDIFTSPGMIFGPALIAAYDLETANAKWPIIAIDPQLIDRLRPAFATAIKHMRKFKPIPGISDNQSHVIMGNLTSIAKTKEGIYFVDYLSCIAIDDATTGDMYYYLQDHGKAIQAAISKYRHYKYDFLAGYHNAYCKVSFPNSSELQILGFDAEPIETLAIEIASEI